MNVSYGPDLGTSRCFDCGSASELHDHHVVPRSLGGTATVALCLECHAKVHGRDRMTSSALTRAGLDRAKSTGKKLGRLPEDRDRSIALAQEAESMRRAGSTYQAIADRFNGRGEPTLRGGAEWRPSSIQKLLQLLCLEREAAELRMKALKS